MNSPLPRGMVGVRSRVNGTPRAPGIGLPRQADHTAALRPHPAVADLVAQAAPEGDPAEHPNEPRAEPATASRAISAACGLTEGKGHGRPAAAAATVVGVIAVDSRGCVTEWDGGAEQTFGRPAAEALGRPLVDVVAPARFRAAHARALAGILGTHATAADGRTAPGTDARVIGRRAVRLLAADRDGREFPVEMLLLPHMPTHRQADGPALTAVVRRPGARPAAGPSADGPWASAAAREDHDLAAATATLINAAPVGVCTFDRDGIVLTWNAACERIFGWAAAEVIGRSVPLALDQKTREFGGLRRLLSAGEPFSNIETPQRRKDGSLVDVSLSAAPLRNSDGSIRGVVAVVVDVSERRRALEEQQKFVSLVENCTDLVAMVALDGRLTYLNETGRRLVGLDPTESVLELRLGDLHAGASASRIADAAVPVALAAGKWEGELQLRNASTGRDIGVRGSLFTVGDRAGRPLCLAAVYRDLTEQKRSEEALRRRDTLLDAVARATGRLLTKTDFGAAVGDALRIIGEGTGVDRVSVMSVHNSPSAGGWLLSPLFRWGGTGEGRLPDTSTLDGLPDATADIAAVMGLDVDDGSVNGAPDDGSDDAPSDARASSTVEGPERRSSSPLASRILPGGWYEPLSAGFPVGGLSEEFTEAEQEWLEEQGIVAVQMLPILIDGTVWGVISFEDCRERHNWNEAEVTTLSAFAGSLGGAIARRQSEGELVITNDELSESLRRQAGMTQQLAQAIKGAEAANEAKSSFLAHMSHEIRTPMTAVLGYADLLLERDQTADDRLNCIQTVRRNARHLLDLINDILDVSKIEAGKMHVERIDCSPWRTVAEVASMMRGRALEKRLRFDVACQTPVPETVRTDPTRLRQILINLAGNAIKFTESGGVTLTLEVVAAGGEGTTPDAGGEGDGGGGPGWLRFAVRDTGIGMTEEQIGRLFQPFSQADSSITRRFGGTGLGLTICKRLAGMLGGDLIVTSVPNQGSTFTLQIPADVPAGTRMLQVPTEAMLDEPPAAGGEASNAGHAPQAPRLSGRVLLAEDGPDNQRLLSLYLRKAGADVAVVENGRLACEQAWAAVSAGTPFGVILMDMQMPELDGYAAANKLRAEGYTGTIIALTAHAMAEDRAKCISSGCTDYLTKPVNRAELIDVTAKYLALAAPPAARTPDGAPEAAAPEVEAAPAAAERIRSEHHDDPDMKELVDLFVAALPRTVDNLRRNLAEGRPDELRAAAHQLKGTGGGFGFPHITRLAAAAEARVHAAGDDPSAARIDVESLIAALRSVEGYAKDQEQYDR